MHSCSVCSLTLAWVVFLLASSSINLFAFAMHFSKLLYLVCNGSLGSLVYNTSNWLDNSSLYSFCKVVLVASFFQSYRCIGWVFGLLTLRLNLIWAVTILWSEFNSTVE